MTTDTPNHTDMTEAARKMWYLREGDLLPEPTSSLFAGRGIESERAAYMLFEAGNLFGTREEAERVSVWVKDALARKAYRADSGSTHRHAGIPSPHLLTRLHKIQRHLEETHDLLLRLQELIQGNDGGQTHSTTPDDRQGKAPASLQNNLP